MDGHMKQQPRPLHLAKFRDMGFRRLFSTLRSGDPGSGPSPVQVPPPETPQDNNGSRYIYTPLIAGREEIRLIQLLPGSGSAVLRIRIETVPFGSEDRPAFDALSYTWGSQEDRDAVYVSGSDGGRIPITRNLRQALLRIRDSRRQPRRLWVDAISINQEDAKERSEQVLWMANVYARATGVIAWLGERSASSALALRTIKTISQNAPADWEFPAGARATGKGNPLLRNGVLRLEPEALLAVSELLQRAYFQRLWVYQEIQLGADRALAVCGPHGISWKAVRDAVRCCRSHAPQVYQGMSAAQSDYILSLCDGNPHHRRGLLECLQQSRSAQCSDDRDRVFSVLSLLSRGHNFGITRTCDEVREGYFKTTALVYIEVMRMFQSRYASVEYLAYIGRRTLAGLPTFIPDWSNNDPGGIFANAYASPHVFDLPWEMDFSRGHPRLLCQGVFISRVAWCSPDYILPANLRESILSGSDRGERLLQALTRVLHGNVFAENHVNVESEYSTSRSSFLESIEEVRKCVETKCRPITPVVHDGRWLLLTEEGKFALGPANTAVGDAIFVLPGCSAAMIFREHPKHRSQYEVIGPAWVEGWMDCEAFLGPLPRSTERVMVSNKDGSRVPWWVDNRHGRMDREDPRLEALLPAGWRRNADESGFENVRTGERRELQHDPRFDMEILRKRGVKLRDIELR